MEIPCDVRHRPRTIKQDFENQTLREHAVSGAIPEEAAYLRAPLVEEHEQVARQRIVSERVLDRRRETVEALPEIRRRRRYEDPDGARQREHQLLPSSATRRA